MQGTQGSISGQGIKILHAKEQLSPYTTTIELQSLRATTTEPTSLNYWTSSARAFVPQQEKSPRWEAQAPQLESSPCSLQLEQSLCSNENQHSQKINKTIKE